MNEDATYAARVAAAEERRCRVCGTWFMSRPQRDHHVVIRHGGPLCPTCGGSTSGHTPPCRCHAKEVI